MEDAAIRDGFEHLRPGVEYERLYQAALCRAGADWLVRIGLGGKDGKDTRSRRQRCEPLGTFEILSEKS